MKAPQKCPVCDEIVKWKKVNMIKNSETLFWGPISLVAKEFSKKRVYYSCEKCGFENEYDA